MSAPAVAEPPRVDRTAAQHAALVFLAALVATGAGAWWAVLNAPDSTRHLTAWAAGAVAAVLSVALAALAYYAETAHRTRGLVVAAAADSSRLHRELAAAAEVRYEFGVAEQRAADARAAQDRLEAALAQVAGQTLPAVLARLHEGASAGDALAGMPVPDQAAVRGLVTGVAEEVAAAERRGAAAMAACASAAARIQAQTTRMLAELRELENRHSDGPVFADLMELDHRVSQLGRLSDGVALLAGGRSGRRWTKPIPMESILRGAMGRIDAYQRIRVHSVSSAAVAGYAAEGVMHALAELMDNAAAFSAHGSEVHVYVEDEDVGVVVTIEDSGLGMRKRERQRAEGLVARSFDLTTLPGTRMGLAVVGRLASRYGLTVNFRPSSRGGSGVVVMVPRQLIAQPRVDPGPTPATVPAPEPEPAPEPVLTPAAADPDRPEMPKRPRGATLAAATRAQEPPPPSAPAPVDRSARFAAFRQAGRPESQ